MLAEKLSGLWKKFCDESTMHGFRELFYARSNIFKVFWVLVIICGSALTCFQIYLVVDNYYENPTKTQITLLPDKKQMKYPTYSIKYKHWCDWINLTKVDEMKFDLQTFLYTTAYFNPLYTTLPMDHSFAVKNLKQIMTDNNITNMYDLALELATKKPMGIYSTEFYYPYFDNDGQANYAVNLKTAELSDSTYETKFYLFPNIATSQFNKQFKKVFNYSMVDEYRLYKRHLLGDNELNESLLSSTTIEYNPIGGKSSFENVDVLRIKYKFYVRATMYNWKPTSEKQCDESGQFQSYTQCEVVCNSKYKIFRPENCYIYLLSTDTSFNSSEELTNSCTFDQNISGTIEVDLAGYQQCLDSCTSSCVQWNYEFNQALYPRQLTDGLITDVKGLVSLKFSDVENTLVINILPAVSWDDAVANVGGLLGLWIGGSILSFIQLIYIFCCTPLDKMCRWMVRKNVATVHATNNDTPIGPAVSSGNEHVSDTHLSKLIKEIGDLQSAVNDMLNNLQKTKKF